jgi:hypothetical protein
MKRYLSLTVLFASAILWLLIPSLAIADPVPVIYYEATNLPDAIPGEDLWMYTYTLSYATADTFSQNQEFDIVFDYALYSDLEDPPPSVTDWFTYVLQPDLSIPDAGFYNALALVDNPSIANPFSVAFQWLGGAAVPGSQPFILYQFNDQGINQGVIGRGVTQNVVPEPASGLLLASGLFIGAILYRKRR